MHNDGPAAKSCEWSMLRASASACAPQFGRARSIARVTLREMWQCGPTPLSSGPVDQSGSCSANVSGGGPVDLGVRHPFPLRRIDDR